jgi:cellulose biosynthesis protein BcsQ
VITHDKLRIFFLISLISEVQEKGNSDLRFLKLLINAVDRRTTVVKSVITLIQKTFGNDQVFNTQIPINTSFEKAEARGQTIFKSDATSIGARKFRNLADEILTLLEGTSNEQK